MRKLRKFNTQEQFEDVKCELERTVCKVDETKSVSVENGSYIIAHFDVNTTTNVTDILGYWTKHNNNVYSPNNIDKMYIDDVLLDKPVREYTFSTIGIHKVKYVCCDISYCEDMFQKCDRLIYVDFSNFDSSNVGYMNFMFNRCVNLKEINGLNKLDTSKVRNIQSMFYDCSSLTSLDVSSFRLKNFPISVSLFAGCKKLSYIKGIEKLDTSQINDMSGMFSGCNSLTSLDLKNWDTSNVSNMSGMFGGCSNLTSLDLSNFDTSKVTDMSNMFYGCGGLTSLDISNFDTSKVTNMCCMFGGCSGLTSLDVSNFDTSNVKYMGTSTYEILEIKHDKRYDLGMFGGCSNLTSLDVSNFDTSNVTNMCCMFKDCYKLTSLDLSNFDTSNVKYMNGTFYGCSGLTSLDISNFDTSNVEYMNGTFAYCSNLTSLDVSNWNVINVKYMGGTAHYSTDYWSQGTFTYCSKINNLDVSKWNTPNLINISYLFGACYGITNIDMSNFNLNNVTDMYGAFYNCRANTIKILSNLNDNVIIERVFDGFVNNNGKLIINCDYEDKWNDICITNQSISRFPSTCTIECETVTE